MWSALQTFKKRVPSLSLAVLFLFTQFAYGLVPFIDVPKVEAATVCVPDTAGANDEPGQKDLTQLCENDAPAAGTSVVSWNWDDKGTSGGGQSLDACGLFDSDGDGFINYSICVTTKNDPAVKDTVTIYTCTADSKVDRCGGPDDIAGAYATTCTVTQTNTDPFPAGNFSPLDTTAACNFVLADLPVPVSSLNLVDVCSYPSREPNSDPSDCVIIQTNPVALIEVIKDIVPNGAGGLFNLSVDGPVTNDTTVVNNVGDGGTTGVVSLAPPNNGGTAMVSETAGTNTNLANYGSSISCVDRGTANVVASGPGTSLQVPVTDGDDIVCTITNTAFGSITIVKDAVPNHAQDFGFTATGTGVAPTFSLDDDAEGTLPNSRAFTNLAAGTYTFTEAQASGWYLDQIDCPNITETQNVANGTVSITIAAGQNITCTFTNRLLGQIIVSKQTNPDNDPTQFSIAASPAGGVIGNANQTIADNGSVTYSVRHNTYSVGETVPTGWTQTSNTCSNLVIDGNTPLVNGIPTRTCAIVNTKLAKLKIIKDAIPNGPQDFAFTTSNNLTGFILDDDVTSVTPLSEVQFNDLAPNQEYSVTEGALTGWDLTSALCNKARTLVGTTLSVTLLPGEDITCTFTNTQRGSISGVKFNDLNGNGIFDQGEPVLSNWNIFIDTNNNGIIDNGEVNMLTDNAGLYTFSNLVPSNYILAEVLLNGWTQTLAPPVVQLAAGQTSTGNNFGNFQNGSVSGLKFNDRNGDGTRGQGEETLAGWTMNLFNDGNDADSLLDDLVATTQTDANGNYSFPNLTLGTYQVCEVQQTGWAQTAPANNGCHLIVIDQSGETNPSKDFGNQGRGSIRVLKNVDTNGDGQVDVTGATDWTWDIAGGTQNTATGSSQNVAAGSYTVSEDQKADYHVTSVSCTGEQGPLVSEQIGVTVFPGENVVCTFVNTRNTGTVTVNKVVNPTNDTGKFNLQVDSNTVGTGANVGHGGTTGAVSVVTGQHTIGETAGTDTTLNNYSTSFSCVNQNQQVVASGNTASSTAFAVNYQDNIVCTITNTRLGAIIVQKQTDPDGDPATFNFTASYDGDGFSLSDGQSNNSGNLLPGTYTVAETVPTGWDLESATCSDQSSPASIQLGAGETVTCVFTNEKDANIIITKQTDPDSDPQTFSFNASYDNDGFSLSDGQSNDSGDLDPGTYSVSENVPAGWDLDSATCSDRSTVSEINLSAGETVTCTFTNEKDANIVVIKQTDPDGSQEVFNFTASYDGDGFGLSDGQSNDSGDLDPGTYSVGEIVPAEWDLVNTTCSDGSASSAINLAAGETVTCTFNNRQDGHIIIQKETDPNGDPTAFNFTASYDGDGFGLSDGQSNDSGNLNPGIYSVSEALPEGWYLDSVTCDDGSLPLAIDLAAGETVTCTFNNVKFASIQISKDTITTNENNQGQDFQFTTTGTGLSNFSLDDDTDPTLESIKTFNNLVAGTYSITEGATAGWDMTGLICFGIDGARRDITGSTATLTLQPGENAVCAYTNTERGSVTIIKDAQPDSVQAFKFTGSLGDPDEEEGPNFTLVDDGTNDTTDRRLFADLENGTYTVTEPNVRGWTLESINCTTEEGVNVNNRNVVIDLQPGENVTCTFVNTRDTANITVTKQTLPEGSEEDFTIRLRDSAEEPAVVQESVLSDNESDSYTVVTGEYNLAEELIPEGWDLTDAVCTRGGDEEEPGPVFDPRGGSFEANKDEDINCVFTNTQRGNVVVTKYNDRNQNGSRDDGEEALAGWDMTLSDGQEEGFSVTQATGPDGTAAFDNVVSGSYALSEDLESQAGWNFSDIDCTGVDGSLDGQTYFMRIAPGAAVNCEVGNFPDAALNITKTNNRPAPTVVGDTVTYTLTVSVPNDSGAVFGTTVQDLPPENFDYVAGSWTATSSVRGDIKAGGTTTEPTYGSPGAWKLGDMLPGEVVTLTYRALIANSVISGTYPDIAFTQGCNTNDPTCTAPGSTQVLGNVSTGANSPFVRTAVAITTPQVLGANTTVLVETGQRLQQALVTTISLILLGLSALVVYRRKEGGRS